MLDLALQELDVRQSALRAVLLGQRQHLVGHVEAVGLAGRPDALRRQQHVDAAAGAEIEHDLARLQLGERGRVAAAQRRLHRRRRHLARLRGVVQVRRDRVAAARRAGRGAAAGALPGLDLQCRQAVFRADDFLDVAGCCHAGLMRIAGAWTGGGDRCDRPRRGGAPGIAGGARTAAVLGEIGDEGVHPRDVRPVPDEAPVLARGDQPGVGQFLQVKRQRRRGQAEALADVAGGEPVGRVLDEQPEHGEAALLREGAQGGQRALRLFGLHGSATIIAQLGCRIARRRPGAPGFPAAVHAARSRPASRTTKRSVSSASPR